MARGLSAFVIASVFVGALTFYVLGEDGVLPYRLSGQENMVVEIHGIPIRVELAETLEERRQGLSGRPQLAPNTGMLFVLDEPGEYGIWMKDMLFSIDIFWLAADGTIVDIKEDARPESYPTVFRPSSPAQYVLEVNAGFADIYDVRVGDPATLPVFGKKK